MENRCLNEHFISDMKMDTSKTTSLTERKNDTSKYTSLQTLRKSLYNRISKNTPT
jgi:hypothetical protein